jgi:hypothetical protein
MRKSRILRPESAMAGQMRRILLRLEPGLRRAIDPGDIFCVLPVGRTALSALWKAIGE